MIGTLDQSRREATVVGAGIAGMLAAYALDRTGYRVTLLEEKARAGGLLRTRSTRYGIAEAAANSLLASPAVTDLCRDLGVELVEVRKEASARYILRDGRLRKFPLTIGETVTSLGHAAFTPALNQAETLDLAAWGRRHLGQAAVDYLLTPLVRGIYGVQPATVSVSAAFPRLLVPPGRSLLANFLTKSFKRSGPKRKRAPMVAPKLGMGDLAARLEARLEERLRERFCKGVQVTDVPDAPNVLLAAPAYKAAHLLWTEAPGLAELLSQVMYTPMISVTAFVERDSFERPVNGVGVLMPAAEKRSCLGILFSSSAFAGRVTDESRLASFTFMLGGSQDGQWLDAGDDEIKSAVQQELYEILGIRGEPLETVIHRWPQAIPQYSIDLPVLWERARQSWCARPGRMLFGNYTGQVSLRGMIESASSLEACSPTM